MKEIKFRGKRMDDGEWIYGDLIHEKDKLLIRYLHPDGQYISYEVIPETVGQYTSLKDKNGKEVYKGDKDLLKEKEYNSKKEKLVELLADLYNTTCEYCQYLNGDDWSNKEELENKIEELQKEVIKIAMKESL